MHSDPMPARVIAGEQLLGPAFSLLVGVHRGRSRAPAVAGFLGLDRPAERPASPARLSFGLFARERSRSPAGAPRGPLTASCAGNEGRVGDPSPPRVRGLEDLPGAPLGRAGELPSLGRTGVLLPLGLGQLEESAHAPNLPQQGPIAGDLAFLVGDDVLAGLPGLPYLLLQRAHGFLGLLPKLLSPVFGEPYLGAQPRLLLPGGLVDLGEPDAGGVEGLAHDEDRALAGDGRRQVGDHPGEALDGQTPRRRLVVPFLGRRPPRAGPAPPPHPPRPALLARVVVDPGVVVLVRLPPE